MNLRFLPLLAQVLWVGTALAQNASKSTTSTSALTSPTVDTIQPTTTTSTSTSSTVSTVQSTITTSTSTSSTVDTTRPTTSACPGNSPNDRSVWCDYSIETDYESDYPNTGNIRRYTFHVENSTIIPLGFPQTAVTINGQFPGPTIYADWGDWVVVTVINSLSRGMKVPAAVSIHWHGIRQLNTTQFDGVPSITQCPIAPGENMTYIWRATQYGTAWYHSHVGLQAWEGVFGGIVINGPATSNYDVDLGVLLLNDWDTKSVYDNYAQTQHTGALTLDSGLLNGTNAFNNTNGIMLPNGTTAVNITGKRFELPVTLGTKYRLRLVNAAVDTVFKFMIDDHPLTVIAMDLVPIQPVVRQNISITMGQRYDVIFTADQLSPDNRFMIRSIPMQTCSENRNPQEIYGYLTYSIPPGSDLNPVPLPPKPPFKRRPNDTCYDVPMDSLKPYVAKNFGVDIHQLRDESINLTKATTPQ